MSFSQRVKEELISRVDAGRHGKEAELSAIVSSCGHYSIRRGGRLFLVLQTESRYPAEKAVQLLRRIYHIVPDLSVMGGGSWSKSRVYTIAVRDNDEVNMILGSLRLLAPSGAIRDLDLPVSGYIIDDDVSRRAFIRGAFISSGSISDPNKSYHLEMAIDNDDKAEAMIAMLNGFGVKAKLTHRKDRSIVYVKESDSISDMLVLMGATVSLMDLENIRILRDISGSVNRQVNCETANLKKTVSAGAEQVRQIKLIQKKKGLDFLPDDLWELARVRLANPDMPLKDLGAMLHPPIGKSGIHHRFERIRRIAEDLE